MQVSTRDQVWAKLVHSWKKERSEKEGEKTKTEHKKEQKKATEKPKDRERNREMHQLCFIACEKMQYTF